MGRAGRVLSCFSFSKTYAMTGMRVGYLVAPRDVAVTAAKLQEALIASVNTPAQYAALAALEGPQVVPRAGGFARATVADSAPRALDNLKACTYSYDVLFSGTAYEAAVVALARGAKRREHCHRARGDIP